MPLDALIFDCDGTLVDSEGIGIQVLAELAAEHGAAFDAEARFEQLRGLKMAECVVRIEAASGVRLPADFVPKVRLRMAAALRQRLKPMDGIHELLSSLRIPFSVASSAPRDKIELSLSLTGLLPFFAGRIFSSYELGSWKPDPGLFLHVARAMNVAPEACGVVEDSRPGILAGVAAGMRVFALNAQDAPYPGGQVHFVPNHHQLKILLDSWSERGTLSEKTP
jgi:HAD superfamily hydrolase (TIGR01509 family)